MLEVPVIRWGKSYESLAKEEVVHFETGETLAYVHQANAGLVNVDMRHAGQARDILRQFSIVDLVKKCSQAADYYLNDELPLGNGTQTPEEFCAIQSATTGLPEAMCASNMKKNAFVLSNMEATLDALTRGLPLDILSKGYGMEDRGVMVSYQANSPVMGLVLPSNSPGVHTLWIPAIPLQIGLVLKPGSKEPWTPYRMFEAFAKAGVPREAFCIYPGGHDVGPAVMDGCGRSKIFGGAPTIEMYKGDPRIQVHGPGFSKIILGDDVVDQWENHLDLMVDSVLVNGGRSCINCSGIWVSRNGKEIAEALAKRLGPVEPLSMTDPDSPLAAFTIDGAAKAIHEQIEDNIKDDSVTEVTEKYRNGSRLVEEERYGFLKPTVVHCSDVDSSMANTEYMFPFVSVVDCPEKDMIKKMGSTLVCTAITGNEALQGELVDATNIDRLNIGEVRTNAMNWLQPHEGNLTDFLFRARAFQNSPPPAH